MYQVYLLYRGTLGTDGTRIFGSISFLQKWSLQKLDADKSSGIPPAADIDLIGVLDVVPTLILFEKRAETLLGKAAQSVIITPQLVNGVQVFGADLIKNAAMSQAAEHRDYRQRADGCGRNPFRD